MNGKLVAQNKKARHDFFFEEIIEAGIVLTGTEIKSVRAGGISLRDSFAKVDDKNEVWVYGVNISPYEQGNRYNTEPLRPKKLLLHKEEIRKINNKLMLDGLTLIPVQVYLNPKGKLKMELAIARGKKLYDKRETTAKRDAQRRMDREMKYK
ncbi:MAG: SsrA-binding protein SmpB [Bacillota bacterium]|nr:SsrA-binding protein SmpB [Bacillota bacterium]